MKIFYFTATGNSLKIAKALGKETISMASKPDKNPETFTDEEIGFVFPFYGSSYPTIVEDFIIKNNFQGKYIFAIITYGSMTMGAEKQFVNFCKENNIYINYVNKIKMLDNSLKYFNIDKEIKKLPNKNVNEQLNTISIDIDNRATKKARGNLITTHISNYEIF